MAAGTPVITSDVSALPEIAGGEAPAPPLRPAPRYPASCFPTVRGPALSQCGGRPTPEDDPGGVVSIARVPCCPSGRAARACRRVESQISVFTTFGTRWQAGFGCKALTFTSSLSCSVTKTYGWLHVTNTFRPRSLVKLWTDWTAFLAIWVTQALPLRRRYQNPRAQPSSMKWRPQRDSNPRYRR